MKKTKQYIHYLYIYKVCKHGYSKRGKLVYFENKNKVEEYLLANGYTSYNKGYDFAKPNKKGKGMKMASYLKVCVGAKIKGIK